MGLTMGCARCHDHKYDPISQKDYYRFFAFFNTIAEKGLDGRTGNAAPILEMPTAEQAEARSRGSKQRSIAREDPAGKATSRRCSAHGRRLASQPPGELREGLLAH